MENKDLNNLIDALLNDESFALIPYNKNIEKELKFLFDFFTNLNKDLLMRKIMVFSSHNGLVMALTTMLHYKGKVPYFNDSLDHSTYNRIKPFLDDNSINRFRVLFEQVYIDMVLNDKLNCVNDINMDKLKLTDINTYILISIKLNLNNINVVFKTNKSMVFDWINKHDQKYNQLKQLNQPQFIFNNMNGKLDINDETLKYFFEICPIDLVVYKELKKTIDLETIWKFTKHKLTVDFILELVDTLEEIIFVLSLPNIPLSTLDSFMKRLETNFPHLYINFNSLLLMKKDFSQ